MKEITPCVCQIKNELTVAVNDAWRRAASLTPAQEYPPGIELFKQESLPRDVYLIEEGLIKLLYVEQNGQEVIVGLRSPGWLVGAAYVVLHKNYAYSATTMTNCRLRRITADAFLNLLKMDAEFAWYFHQVQSYELYDQLTQLVGFGCLSARDKLEQLFVRLVSAMESQSDEQGVRLKLPLKHWELARIIGVTPEHLSRVLKEMQKEGVIVRERGWIGITDVKRLR